MFVEQHIQEWEAQKKCPYETNDLERAMEDFYNRCLWAWQEESKVAESREEEARNLPLECQQVRNPHKQQAMTKKDSICPADAESNYHLYPNWHPRPSTKPPKEDEWHPYRALKENMSDWDQALGMATIVDPLASAPSSQPSSQQASQLDTLHRYTIVTSSVHPDVRPGKA